MSEHRFLYGIIRNNIFCWIIVFLLLAIGFQAWIIRSRGYEITTLRNENISCRADAEDMRRMLAELTNDFDLIPREKCVERIQRAHYFSDGLAATRASAAAWLQAVMKRASPNMVAAGYFAQWTSNA